MFREYKVVIIALSMLMVVIIATGYIGPDPAITSYGKQVGKVKDGNIMKKAYYDITYTNDDQNIPKGTVIHNVYMEPQTQKDDKVTYTPASTFIKIDEKTKVDYATTLQLSEQVYTIDFSNLGDDEAVEIITNDNYQGSTMLYDNTSAPITYTPLKNNAKVSFTFYKKQKSAKPIEYYEFNGNEVKKDFLVSNETGGVVISTEDDVSSEN